MNTRNRLLSLGWKGLGERANFVSKPPVERRQSQQDRRGLERQGKFDRRKNRCGQCRFWDKAARWCQQHQTGMAEDAFACLLFERLS